jgi:hypothetical protein
VAVERSEFRRDAPRVGDRAFGSEGAEGSLADIRMNGAIVFDGLRERIGVASRSLWIDHQKYQLGLNDWLIINRGAPSALDEFARHRFVRAKAAE